MQEIAISKKGKLLSDTYTTAKAKYTFSCDKGHEFELTADKVIGRGDWCTFCCGRYGDFENEIRHIIEVVNKGKMLSPYVNSVMPIKCQCAKGHINYQSASNLKAGKWCGKCIISRGENVIKKHFDFNNIPYKQQYWYADLKGKKQPLPFDFAVLKDNKVTCLIEYQGEQHYRPMRHSSHVERNIMKFEQTQKYDKLKQEYCLKNNIPLIIISCLDFNERNMKKMIKHINNMLLVEVYQYL